MSENQAKVAQELVYWHPGLPCCNPVWEAAYRKFETPGQEIEKFVKRLLDAEIDLLPKNLAAVELFCGRGNGLHALQQLGFEQLAGVDLSADLLRQYSGSANMFVGDCRELKFADDSQDLVVIQGGLHHLPTLPDDLERVLAEINRVLRPSGTVFVVEPWTTPFLSLVHGACRFRPARSAWEKLDALATMIENEIDTYRQWLNQPRAIERLFAKFFVAQHKQISYGKFIFKGQPIPEKLA